MPSGRDSPLRPSNESQLQAAQPTDKTDQEPQNAQEELIERIKNNLFIKADSFHLEAVLAKHVPEGFQPPPNPDFSEAWTDAMKPKGEEAHYKPLAKYLNDCLAATRTAYNALEQKPCKPNAMDHLFTESYQWMYNDIPCASRYGSPIKPDIVGCQFEIIPKDSMLNAKQRASWEHMISYVEVKNNWLNMIAQSATYARQIFADQPDRVSCRFVLYNQKEMKACIGECDRAGYYLTHLYDLKVTESQQRFAFLLAGMYCSSLEANGYNRCIQWKSKDLKLTEVKVRWRNKWFKVEKVLCYRMGLWSRCTRAFALKSTASTGQNLAADIEARLNIDEEMEEARADFEGLKTPIAKIPSSSLVSTRPKLLESEIALELPSPLIEAQDFNAEKPFTLLEYWNHTSHRDDDDRKIIETLIKLRVADAGEDKVTKVINGIASFGQRQEGRVTVYGQGPAPDSSNVGYYYKDCEDKTKKGKAEHLKEDNNDRVIQLLAEKVPKKSRAKFVVSMSNKSAFSNHTSMKVDNAKSPTPRSQTFQETYEVGETLLTITNITNKKIVETLIGALKGYRNAYNLGHINRDVSPTNIISINSSVRKGKGVTVYDIDKKKKLVEAPDPVTGLLIDMNLTIKKDRTNWASEDNPGLTGTRIFVAAHLLDDVNAKPSAIYDLESFFWTLVFTILFHNESKLKEWDTHFWNQLHPKVRDYSEDSTVKQGLFTRVKTTGKIPRESFLKPFAGLITKWVNLAIGYCDEASEEGFKGYKPEVEASAIDKYIAAAENTDIA